MEHGAGHMALAGYCRPPSSGGLYGVVGPGGALSARNALAATALLANGAVGPLALRGVFFGEGGARTRTLLWASAALLAAFVLLAEGGGGQLVPRAAALLHLLHLPLLAATHTPAAAASGGSALALVSAAGSARGAASGCCVGLVASLYGRGAARAFVLAQRWLAVYGAGFVLPWMGVWAFLECPGHGLGFFGDEIGHIIPVSCIGLGAVVSLLFTGVGHSHAQRVALQRVEGRLTFVLGAIFLAEHTAGQKGGVFYPLLFGHTSPDWMKNQQHTFDGLAWLACGALALVCAAKNLATGLHFLVPALLNVHMMFSHPQHCAHESWGHWLHALALAVGALFRACNRPAEWTYFALLSAMLFVGASPCAVEWWAANVTVVAQGLLLAAVSALLWSFHVWLWVPPAQSPPELPARGNPKAGYKVNGEVYELVGEDDGDAV